MVQVRAPGSAYTTVYRTIGLQPPGTALLHMAAPWPWVAAEQGKNLQTILTRILKFEVRAA